MGVDFRGARREEMRRGEGRKEERIGLVAGWGLGMVALRGRGGGGGDGRGEGFVDGAVRVVGDWREREPRRRESSFS